MGAENNSSNSGPIERAGEPPVTIIRTIEPSGIIDTDIDGTTPVIGNASGIVDDSDNRGDDSGSTDRNTPSEFIGGIRVADPGGESGEYGFKSDGTPRAKPGRKPSGNSTKRPAGKQSTTKTKASSADGIERVLFSLHAILAAKTKSPEWAIDKSEARAMANAIADVQEFYGVQLPAEVQLWVNLVTTSATVYGPRIFIAYNKKKKADKEKTEARLQQSDNVTSFPPIAGLPSQFGN